MRTSSGLALADVGKAAPSASAWTLPQFAKSRPHSLSSTGAICSFA